MSQKDLDMAKDQDEVVSDDDQQSQTEPDRETPRLDSELANIIEAALYAAKEPLGVRKLISLFPEDAQPTKVDIQNVIMTLEEQCANRGVELRRIGNGWRFQTKEKYAPWLRKLSGQKAPRYSRALLETLSIIAYRQPVTRGDIEEIRGVGVSSDTIRVLEEREWIVQIGHRDVPGRPALFGTSQGFLEYFDMTSLSDLPDLMEKRDLQSIAKDMNLTLPMDGVQDEVDIASAQNSEPDDESSSAEVIELRPSESVAQAEISEIDQVNDSDENVEGEGQNDESQNHEVLTEPDDDSDPDHD